MSLQATVDMVTTLVPGAGKAMVEKVVLDTAKDFFTFAPLWKHFAQIDAETDLHTYSVVTPYPFAKMLGVKCGDRTASPVDSRSMIALQDTREQRSYPNLTYFVDLAGDLPTLVVSDSPEEDTADWITFEASMYPKAIADLPAQLAITYEQTLVEGSVCLLFKQTARPYTNLQLAALHGATYRGLRSKAYRNLMTSNAHTTPGFIYPYFA